MKQFNNLQGFTLIELLVVISLVGIIMISTVGLLLSVLRTSRKNENQVTVKQKGGHALEIMGGMIRNAQEITACQTASLTLTNPDNDTTVFSCVAGGPDVGKISSNSADLISPGPNTTVSDCNFSCSLGTSGVPGSATIQFKLTSGNEPQAQSSATFTSTFSLRNY